jgi:hypothetical protein
MAKKKREKPQVRLDRDLLMVLQQSRLSGKNHMTGHTVESRNNDRVAREAAERVQSRIRDLEAQLKEKKRDPNDDLFVIRLGRAGIGRMGYRAYFDEEVIDRSDGSDAGTSTTPGKALIKLAKKFDKELVQYGWQVLDTTKSGIEDNKTAVKGVKQRVLLHLYGDEG